jgi:Zn-dependent protease
MFTARWQLFRLFGIPISLDISWLFILVLVTGTLAVQFFPNAMPGVSAAAAWGMGLITALAFFACIVLHEMGHALVARSRGMPIRGITLFLFGGVAELGSEPVTAGSEFLMAIAGPLVSAVLGVGFLIAAAFLTAGGEVSPAGLILNYLGRINLMILAFNLVPAFPLDGGRVFRSILWAALGNLRRATHWASLVGQGFAWFLIAGGVFEVFAAHDLFSGIWLGLIGLFLNNAARGSYQQVLVRELLKGEPVRRFMTPEPIEVPPNLDLHHWVEDYVYRFHRKAFPVAANGHVEGYITTQALARFPREQWDQHTVAEAMRHDHQTVTVGPETDALQALGKMQRTGASRLLVVDRDRLVGIVSLKDLLHFFQLKIELESGGD